MDREFTSLDKAIDRFCKHEFGDAWIEGLSDDERNLIRWYILGGRVCTPGIKRQAERAQLRQEKMLQQMRDAQRWLETHVRIEWSDVERSHIVDDHRSAYKASISGRIKTAALDEALADRFKAAPPKNDSRTKKEIIEEYILETKAAGGRPTQAAAENVLKEAGRTWDRESIRAAFNEMALKHQIRVTKGKLSKRQ
jgi:hypothetical protein